MNELADNEEDVARFIARERFADAYATQVALSVWGEAVESVQWQVWRQNIVPFEARNDPDSKRPAPTILASGWRGLIELPGQSRDDFANTFLAQYQRIAGE